MKQLLQNTWAVLTIVGIVAVLRFVNLGFADIQVWDEALYGVRAESVVRFGDWWDQTPHSIEGLYSSLHPPIYIWCTAGAYALLGVNEFSTRLFSALFGAGTIFLVYLVGKRILNRTTGFVAALFLGLNPFFTFWTRQAQLDATLTFFITLSLLFICHLISDGRHTGLWVILSGVAVGLALMTKLFVALIVPVALLLGSVIYDRSNWRRSLWHVLLITGIALLIALPWHLMMTLKYGSGDVLFFLSQSAMIQRTFFGIEGNVKELGWLYFVNQLTVVMPYALAFFIYGLYRILRRRQMEDGLNTTEAASSAWLSRNANTDSLERNRSSKTFGNTPRESLFAWRLISVWFLAFLIVFALIRTKLAVYTLPMLVPISLIAAYVVTSILPAHAFRTGGGQLPRQSVSPKTLTGLCVLTAINVLWAANHGWRLAIRNVMNAFMGMAPLNNSDVMRAFLFLLLAFAFGIGLVLLYRKRLLYTVLPKFLVPALLSPLFLIFAYNIFILDKQQYNDGGKALAEFLEARSYTSILAVGNGVNPQLTYYLGGIDVGWQKDKTFRRLEPRDGVQKIRRFLSETSERDFYVIIEKDEMLLGSYRSVEDVVPAEYKEIFESREYVVFER